MYSKLETEKIELQLYAYSADLNRINIGNRWTEVRGIWTPIITPGLGNADAQWVSSYLL